MSGSTGSPTGRRPSSSFEEAQRVARCRDLEWYETLAMVRSTAVMTRIGYLRQMAGEPLLLPIDDNPVLDLIKERIR